MANSGLNIVKQYERMVVFKFGSFTEVRGPGIRWLWPIINNGTKTVDLREVPVVIPRQTSITRDNAPIDIDFFVYMRVMEDRPQDTILNISNFSQAAQALAMTTLRAVVGEMDLDDVLSKRERINGALQLKLDEVTVNWGVKVTRVEIREVELGFVETVLDRSAREGAGVLVATEALLFAGGNDLAVDEQRRGGVVPLRNSILALVSAGVQRF